MTPEEIEADARRGRVYARDVPVRWWAGQNTCIDGCERPFLVKVSNDYTPERPWPVVLYLHGAVSRPDLEVEGHKLNLEQLFGWGVAEGKYILAAPITNRSAKWWTECGARHALDVLRHLKERYNIDENRVVCTGHSDGGSGCYYLAANCTTPFAGFLCLSPWLPAAEAGGDPFFAGNLVNKPIYVVHGENDDLFPAPEVTNHVETLRQAGVPIQLDLRPEGSHSSLSYWRRARQGAMDFIAGAVRNPFPDVLDWEAIHPVRRRCHWIEIDGMKDPRAAGRVRASRTGNRLEVATANVASYTVLVSRDMVDIARPLEVMTDGHPSFAGVVVPDAALLRAQAVLDQDRRMVFLAKVTVDTDRDDPAGPIHDSFMNKSG